MSLIQFNVYFRDYLCVLTIISVYIPDGRENRLFDAGSSPGRRENSVVAI